MFKNDKEYIKEIKKAYADYQNNIIDLDTKNKIIRRAVSCISDYVLGVSLINKYDAW